MGLETGAQFIGELVPAWPLASDPKAEGADHLNIIKRCLQGSLGDMPGRMQFPGNNIPFQGQLVNDDYIDLIKIGDNDQVTISQAGVASRIQGSLFVQEGVEALGASIFRGGLISSLAFTVNAGGANITGTLTVNGGANITGAVSILGGNNLAVTGASTLTGVVNVNSILFANQGIEIAAGAVITGGLNITGATVTQGGLTVNGGSLSTTGTFTSGFGITVQSGGANITGNGVITGTLSSGALTVTSGGANITGTLELDGGANIQGSVSIFSNLILASGGNQTINGGVLTVNTVSGEDRGTLLMRRTGADASHFIDFDNNNNASIVNGRYGFYLRDDGYLIIGNDDVDDAFQIFKAGAGVAHVIMNKIAEVDPGIPGALWHMAGDPVVRISL